jgi:transcriptional regulator with XRE-family HTH domain
MYESIEENELFDYLSNPDVRHLYLDSSIRHLIATQLKSMREAREWSQIEAGQEVGMKQSAIARLEDPRYSRTTLSTLKRLAKAFDVALIVRFAPFSEFISWTAQINEACLAPPSFDEEQNHKFSINKIIWFDTNDNEYYRQNTRPNEQDKFNFEKYSTFDTSNTKKELVNVTQ